MLWALTIPVLEERTDFGAISPVMVLIRRIFLSAMLFSSAVAGEEAVINANTVKTAKIEWILVMESTVIP